VKLSTVFATCALLVAGLHASSVARADGATQATPAEDPKRAPPDYGGPPSETTAGDVAAWPARVVLFPIYLVNDFLLRRPLGALITAAERGKWVANVVGFFTFGDRQQITIFPSALFDFGLKPSVGFNAAWKYLGTDANTARLHFGTWGPNWISVKGSDTYDLSKREHLFVEGSVVRRADNPFFGIGPHSSEDNRTRYASTVTDVAAGHKWTFWRSSSIESRVGLRTLLFHQGGCCGDPTLADAVAAGQLPAPPGLGRGYAGPFQRLALAVDSRRPRPEPGGGVRLEAHEESVFPLDAPAGEQRRSWIKYGGAIGAAVDLTGTQRVLGLQVDAELVDPLSGVIPFPDQVTLGGDSLMPGYLIGRLVDRTSLVATLQYRWPVWIYLDGVMHASVGNVWGDRFKGYDVKSNRLSTGLGVRSNGERDSGFELLVAVGTDPFDEGFSVSSFRLVFGSHHGF
jgi:hypothetical protein